MVVEVRRSSAAVWEQRIAELLERVRPLCASGEAPHQPDALRGDDGLCCCEHWHELRAELHELRNAKFWQQVAHDANLARAKMAARLAVSATNRRKIDEGA